jgi:transposase-like protein
VSTWSDDGHFHASHRYRQEPGADCTQARRTMEGKRRIVEETLVEGASVARVARAHDVNGNLVFGWRKLYLAGRLGNSQTIAAQGKREFVAADDFTQL